ncbi:MAG: DUF2207 domain-containing protein [Lachnospiraceae bacterium]|jgi:hypothetical protein|nr:DUF2207 domain-containing protein [Lachnospiraceae bacterium]
MPARARISKARFKTKLSRAQKWKNALVFLAVFVCSYVFVLLFGHGIGVLEGWASPETYLLTLAMTLFILIMLIFPVMLAGVALGIQMGKAKRVKDNVTFAPIQDIDYYRDTLDALNPSLVSLLVDLDIYGQKDIAATLLRMRNKKLISFRDDGRIVVTGRDSAETKDTAKPGSAEGKSPAAGRRLSGAHGGAKPDRAELELLSAIKNGRLDGKGALRLWRQHRFNEAERLGYIRKKQAGVKKYEKYAWFAVLSLLVVFVLWGVFLHIDIHTHPVLWFLTALPIGALAFVPWYLLVREATYWNRGDVVWERTPLGNEMAEKIAGLSRFIHEFSKLSEADKELVALWDDYLVYAVVLEENEKIVKDICKRHKINMRSFGRLMY